MWAKNFQQWLSSQWVTPAPLKAAGPKRRKQLRKDLVIKSLQRTFPRDVSLQGDVTLSRKCPQQGQDLPLSHGQAAGDREWQDKFGSLKAWAGCRREQPLCPPAPAATFTHPAPAPSLPRTSQNSSLDRDTPRKDIRGAGESRQLCRTATQHQSWSRREEITPAAGLAGCERLWERWPSSWPCCWQCWASSGTDTAMEGGAEHRAARGEGSGTRGLVLHQILCSEHSSGALKALKKAALPLKGPNSEEPSQQRRLWWELERSTAFPTGEFRVYPPGEGDL